jgi:hypothetical protein
MWLAAGLAAAVGGYIGAYVALRTAHAPTEDERGAFEVNEVNEPGEWTPRMSPSRYLARFPEGIHAEQARDLIER